MLDRSEDGLWPSTLTNEHISQRAKPLPKLSPRKVFVSGTKRRYHKLISGWWAWEVTAAFVSILAMLSLVGFLCAVDNKEQSAWPVAGTELSLNTIVAGIGTIIRASLFIVVAGALNQGAWNWFASASHQAIGRRLKDFETFSEAAANSWNCLKLLWRTKFRYLVSLGAMVMIFLIAFDLVLQQTLRTELQQQSTRLIAEELHANNIIPRTMDFNLTKFFEPLDSSLRFHAHLSGSIAQDPLIKTSINCPTGNCSWPVTPTIGVCSKCIQVQPTISFLDTGPWYNTTTFYSLPSLWPLPGNGDSYNISDYRCENNHTTSFQVSTLCMQCRVDHGGDIGGCGFDSVDYGDLTNFNKINRYVTESFNATLIQMYFFGPKHDKSDVGMDGFQAYQCNLHLCMQGFNAHTSAGETVQIPLTDGSYKVKMNDGGIVDGIAQFQWEFTDFSPSLNVREGDRFIVDETDRGYLAFMIASNLQGSGHYASQNGGWRWSSSLAGAFFRASSSLDDMSSLMASLASGLTTLGRASTAQPPIDPFYAPTVAITVSIVVVRWIWLLYAVVLQLASLVFFSLTFVYTNRLNVRPWKGNRMSLLLANLDGSLHHAARGGLAHRTGLDDRVGHVKVVLEFDGKDGITFRQMDEPGIKNSTSRV